MSTQTGGTSGVATQNSDRGSEKRCALLKRRTLEACAVARFMLVGGITRARDGVVVLASLGLTDTTTKTEERLTIFAKIFLTTTVQARGLVIVGYGQVTIGQAVPC